MRSDFELGGYSLLDLAQHYDVPVDVVQQRARRCKWGRRGLGLAERKELINRLWTALEKQLASLERRLHGLDECGEKEGKMLVELVRGMERLIVLDPDGGKGAAADAVAAQRMNEVRDELAKRIDAITKG